MSCLLFVPGLGRGIHDWLPLFGSRRTTLQTLLFVLKALLGDLNVRRVQFDSEEVLAVLEGSNPGGGSPGEGIEDGAGNGVTGIAGAGGLPATFSNGSAHPVMPYTLSTVWLACAGAAPSTQIFRWLTIYRPLFVYYSLPWCSTFGAATLLAGAGFYAGERQFYWHGCEMCFAKWAGIYFPNRSFVAAWCYYQ